MSNPESRPALSGLPNSPVPLDMCGTAEAARLLGDSWALLIMREVLYGVTRFDDLRAELAMSSATLSNRTARLVEIGLLEKRSYRIGKARPRSEYVPTSAGQAFGKVLFAMMEWADEHLEKDASPLDLVDPASGNRLHLALADSAGKVTDWAEAVPVVRSDQIAKRKNLRKKSS